MHYYNFIFIAISLPGCKLNLSIFGSGTVVTTSQDVHETLVPTPPQDQVFNGFDGGCVGAGPCILDISKSDADHAQDFAIEAHFEQDAPPGTATYTYNYLNQRQSKTVSGVTTYYIYDEQGHLLSELNSSGQSTKDYDVQESTSVASAWMRRSDRVHGWRVCCPCRATRRYCEW